MHTIYAATRKRTRAKTRATRLKGRGAILLIERNIFASFVEIPDSLEPRRNGIAVNPANRGISRRNTRQHSTDSIIVRAEWDAITGTEIETDGTRARAREKKKLGRKKRGHVAKRQFNPCQRGEKKR